MFWRAWPALPQTGCWWSLPPGIEVDRAEPRPSRRSVGTPLDRIVTRHAVGSDRQQPTGNKDTDDQVAYSSEIVVQCANEIPESAAQPELVAEQPQRLDATNQKRDDNRNQRDRQIVVEF